LLLKGALLEATQQGARANFSSEDLARQRLHILSRLKRGGITRISELREPAVLWSILDILPKCIDEKDDNGDIVKGVYAKRFGDNIIGESGFNKTGHMKSIFLQSQEVDPFPREC